MWALYLPRWDTVVCWSHPNAETPPSACARALQLQWHLHSLVRITFPHLCSAFCLPFSPRVSWAFLISPTHIDWLFAFSFCLSILHILFFLLTIVPFLQSFTCDHPLFSYPFLFIPIISLLKLYHFAPSALQLINDDKTKWLRVDSRIRLWTQIFHLLALWPWAKKLYVSVSLFGKWGLW